MPALMTKLILAPDISVWGSRYKLYWYTCIPVVWLNPPPPTCGIPFPFIPTRGEIDRYIITYCIHKLEHGYCHNCTHITVTSLIIMILRAVTEHFTHCQYFRPRFCPVDLISVMENFALIEISRGISLWNGRWKWFLSWPEWNPLNSCFKFVFFSSFYIPLLLKCVPILFSLCMILFTGTHLSFGFFELTMLSSKCGVLTLLIWERERERRVRERDRQTEREGGVEEERERERERVSEREKEGGGTSFSTGGLRFRQYRVATGRETQSTIGIRYTSSTGAG